MSNFVKKTGTALFLAGTMAVGGAAMSTSASAAPIGHETITSDGGSSSQSVTINEDNAREVGKKLVEGSTPYAEGQAGFMELYAELAGGF